MKNRWMGLTGAGLACALLLSGCGEVRVRQLWPFGGDTASERSRTLANATEYQCAGNKRFHVRLLDGGAAAWLILAERELRLEKLGADSAQRYSNGIAVLEINGNEATLNDGAAISFAACKAVNS